MNDRTGLVIRDMRGQPLDQAIHFLDLAGFGGAHSPRVVAPGPGSVIAWHQHVVEVMLDHRFGPESNKRQRLAETGATRTAQDAVTRLAVIADDADLRAHYERVVQDWLVRTEGSGAGTSMLAMRAAEEEKSHEAV